KQLPQHLMFGIGAVAAQGLCDHLPRPTWNQADLGQIHLCLLLIQLIADALGELPALPVQWFVPWHGTHGMRNVATQLVLSTLPAITDPFVVLQPPAVFL